MPIVGMTRREDVTPKFPDLGKLRKGGPKTDPKRPGPDLDHWRFTSERRDVQAAFDTAYGDKAATVEAYLPFATMEENWQTWYEEYDHGGMVHRCDGRTMYRWRNGNGEYTDGERPCPYFSGAKPRTKDNPGCKQVGRLNLIVPQLIRAGFVGFVAMETHSINDLVSITACLIDAERKAGKLSGILFNVIRVKQTISTPAWKDEDKAAGKRNRTVKDLVKIVPAADWVMARLQLEAEQQMALASGHAPQITDGENGHDEYEDVEDGDYVDLDALPTDARTHSQLGTVPAPGNGHAATLQPEPGGTAGHAPLEATQPAGNGHAPEEPPPTSGMVVNSDGSFRLIEPPASDAEFDSLPNAAPAVAIRERVVGKKRKNETTAHTDIVSKLQGGLHIAVPNDDERHALEVFMLGAQDSATWTQGQVMAMRTWLNIGTAGTNEQGKPIYAPGAKFLDDWKVIKAAILPQPAEVVGK